MSCMPFPFCINNFLVLALLFSCSCFPALIFLYNNNNNNNNHNNLNLGRQNTRSHSSIIVWCQPDGLIKEGRWDSPHSRGMYHQKIGFKMHLPICLGVYPTPFVPVSVGFQGPRRGRGSCSCYPNLSESSLTPKSLAQD